MNEIKERYNRICRACMTKSNRMRKIFNSEIDSIPISQMLSFATPINVRPDDDLPSSICYTCLNQLIGAYKFQQMCIDSDLQMRLELKKFKTYDTNNIDSRIRSISPNVLDNIQSGVTEGIPMDSDEDDDFYTYGGNNSVNDDVEDYHCNSNDDNDDVIVISSTVDSLIKNKNRNVENAFKIERNLSANQINANNEKLIEPTSLTGTDIVLKLENNDSEYDKQVTKMKNLANESFGTRDNDQHNQSQQNSKTTITKKSNENNQNKNESLNNSSSSIIYSIQQNPKQQQIAKITNVISLASQSQQKSPQQQLKLQFNTLNKETGGVESLVQSPESKPQSSFSSSLSLSSINRLQVRKTTEMMAKKTTTTLGSSSMLQTPIAVTTLTPMSKTTLTYSEKPSTSSTRQQYDTMVKNGQQHQQRQLNTLKENDLQMKIVAFVCSICKVVFSKKENFIEHKKVDCRRLNSLQTTKSSGISISTSSLSLIPSTSSGLSNLDNSKIEDMTTTQLQMCDKLRYRCTGCSKLYKQKIDFHQHLVSEHSTRSYKPDRNHNLAQGKIIVDCLPVYGYDKEKNQFTYSLSTTKKPSICYLCKKDCINLVGLNKHLLEHKKSSISSLITKTASSSTNVDNNSTITKPINKMSLSKKFYTCSKCKTLYTSLTELTQHLNEHKQKISKHQCNLCKKDFNTWSELNTHLNNHKVNLIYDTNDAKTNPTVNVRVNINTDLKKCFSKKDEMSCLLNNKNNYSNSTQVTRLLDNVDKVVNNPNKNLTMTTSTTTTSSSSITTTTSTITTVTTSSNTKEKIEVSNDNCGIKIKKEKPDEEELAKSTKTKESENHNVEAMTTENNLSLSLPTTSDPLHIVSTLSPIRLLTTTSNGVQTICPEQTVENVDSYNQEFVSVDNNLSDTFINEGEEDIIDIKNVTLSNQSLSPQKSGNVLTELVTTENSINDSDDDNNTDDNDNDDEKEIDTNNRNHSNTKLKSLKYDKYDVCLSERHNKRGHEKREPHFQFMCSLCGKSFQNKQRTADHCMNTHGMSSDWSTIIVEFPRKSSNVKNTLKCDYCTESFIDYSKQLGHVRLKHSKDYKSFVIKLIDSQEKDAEENNLLNYNCYFCETEHNEKKSFLQHLKAHRVNFSSDDNLSQNRNSPTENKIGSKIRCEFCSKEFHKKNLKYHIMSVHCKNNSKGLLQHGVTRLQIDKEKSVDRNKSSNIYDNVDNKNKIIKIKSECKFDNNCPICFKNFVNTHILKRHIRVIHVARGDILKENLIMDDIESRGIQFRCDECKIVLHSYKSLERHKKVNHEDKTESERQWYQCSTCHKRFLLKSNYESHRKIHESTTKNYHEEKENEENDDSKMSKLLEVNSNSVSEVTSVDEMESQINERSIAGKQLSDENCIPGHSDPHRCLYCRKIFANRSSFVRHLNKLHAQYLTKKLPQSNEVHQCQICTRIVSARYKLKQHMARHIPDSNELKTLKPSSVQSSFTVKNETESASNSTDNSKKKKQFEYKASCKICKRSYVSYGNAKRHLMADHKMNNLKCDKYIKLLDRPYKCKFCSKTFHSNSSYSKHLELFCMKRNKKNLEKQTQLNDNDSVNLNHKKKCEYCDNSYVKDADLKRHIIMKHRKLLQKNDEKNIPNSDLELQPPNKKTKLVRRNTLPTTIEAVTPLLSSSISSVQLLICRICGRKFTRKDHLEKHQEVHERGYRNIGKMYIRCIICNKYLKDLTSFHFEIYHAFSNETIKSGKYKNYVDIREIATLDELNSNSKSSKDKSILQRRKSVHQIETVKPLSSPSTLSFNQYNSNKRMTRRNTIMIDATETNTFLCLEDIKPKRKKSIFLNINSKEDETKENSDNLEGDNSCASKAITVEKVKSKENNTMDKLEIFAEFTTLQEKNDNLDNLISVDTAATTKVKDCEENTNKNQNQDKNNLKFVNDFENIALEVRTIDDNIENEDKLLKKIEKNVDKKENTNILEKNDIGNTKMNKHQKIEIFDLEKDSSELKNFDNGVKQIATLDDNKKLKNDKEISKAEIKHESNDKKSNADTLNSTTNSVENVEYGIQKERSNVSNDLKKIQQNKTNDDEEKELRLSISPEVEMDNE